MGGLYCLTPAVLDFNSETKKKERTPPYLMTSYSVGWGGLPVHVGGVRKSHFSGNSGQANKITRDLHACKFSDIQVKMCEKHFGVGGRGCGNTQNVGTGD